MAYDLLRSWRHDDAAVLCAFDLIEIDGKDLRSAPIEQRKHALADVLQRERDGIAFNVHYDWLEPSSCKSALDASICSAANSAACFWEAEVD